MVFGRYGDLDWRHLHKNNGNIKLGLQIRIPAVAGTYTVPWWLINTLEGIEVGYNIGA